MLAKKIVDVTSIFLNKSWTLVLCFDPLTSKHMQVASKDIIFGQLNFMLFLAITLNMFEMY